MKVKKLLLVLFFKAILVSNAQSYEFSTSTATYADLQGSTSLNGTATWDDPEFIIPIGFDFQFFDITLSEIVIDDVGVGGVLSPNPNDTGIKPVLIAYGADVADRGYNAMIGDEPTGSQSTISYLTEGEEGSRILKIEWKNVGFFSEVEDNNESTDFMNFQLWFFEGSNDIEIHFGPNSVTQPNISFDGETGSVIGLLPSFDFTNDLLVEEGIIYFGDPTNPSMTTVSDLEEVTDFFDGAIPDGTVYKLTMTTLDTNDFFKDTGFQLYPNPTHRFITVDGISTEKEYEIFTVLGRTMAKGTVQNRESIDIENFSDGVYFIQIENNRPIRFVKR